MKSLPRVSTITRTAIKTLFNKNYRRQNRSKTGAIDLAQEESHQGRLPPGQPQVNRGGAQEGARGKVREGRGGRANGEWRREKPVRGGRHLAPGPDHHAAVERR